ncbi:uncharacterized protein LOC131234590 isoform X2 [Magnolia sinica]|uniref:uncharacterized protein LOC131234590 isoform X2 n=1 Tax=Magnolia sinica TaxID=86752 RepID=UPI00265B0F4B|nr:uncharacterized protein LOC131234590 isoform X2 [Magnolia sinica]
MSTLTSIPSNSSRSLNLHSRRRPQAQIIGSSLRWLLASRGAQSARMTGKGRSELHTVTNSSSLPGAPKPPSLNLPSWACWILRSLLSIVLPFLKLKGGFSQIIGKVEQVVNMVEDVVEAVEDVAEVVEHVADKVGDNLPDNTPLKCVALWVENAAKEVGDDAEQAKDFIDKVEDLTEAVEKKVDQLIDSFTGDEGEAVQKETSAVGMAEEVGQPFIEQKELIMKEEAAVKEEASTR